MRELSDAGCDRLAQDAGLPYSTGTERTLIRAGYAAGYCAAQAEAPPREPTQTMLTAGWRCMGTTAAAWRAMHDAWTQEQTSGPAADPLSHAWKSGYAQAKEESALEQQFCPHCNPCCGDGNDKCRKPAADPIADLARRLRALRIVDEVHSDNPLGRDAADALERLARGLRQEEEYYADMKIRAERAEAERDTLRDIVRAADAMALECRRVGLISSTWLEDYDDARAKVKP